MLFNSYTFLFVFIPVLVVGYVLISGLRLRRGAIAWLVLGSLVYYGWWNPRYLVLLGFSVLFNYAVGVRLSGAGRGSRDNFRGRLALGVGIAVNLALLGYFKYANFFADSLDAAAGVDLGLPPIVLPLAISFFTFQQIAYLVDAWRGEAREYNLLDYTLFVTFFPQLIAGPIVHHAEMMPQFARRGGMGIRATNASIGVTIFTIGLAKKVLLADALFPFASPVFDAALSGEVGFVDAWIGALCYSLALYFDFSGYTDMAIGVARVFGIQLPINFNSPYKATSVVDFWRRWHITLSRFLRDYLYIPLGGNRRGTARRYVNLMITMLLGGLWHGAGWTFVFWGFLHGLFICINHGWAVLKPRLGFTGKPTAAGRATAIAATFLAVTFAWLFFRAESFEAAWRMLTAMVGVNGLDAAQVVDPDNALPWLLPMLAIVFFAPNTQQIMAHVRPALGVDGAAPRPALDLRWKPQPHWALAIAGLGIWAVMMMSRYSEFIYYDF